MALVRWAPQRTAYPVGSEINRLFTTLFDSATPVAAVTSAARGFAPAVDIVESESEFVMRADLPGIGEDDVKLEILDGVLTLSGERTSESDETTDGYRRIERFSGSFSRSLRLPKGVDASAVSASFDKGVLEIHIPKPAESKPQPVQITVG